MERSLWDSRDPGRGKHRRGGRGGYRGAHEGHRGRGRGGYHSSGTGELWDSRDSQVHKPVESESHDLPPTSVPMRIQIKTRSASPGLKSDTGAAQGASNLPGSSTSRRLVDNVEKRSGTSARRPVLQVDSEHHKSRSSPITGRHAGHVKWLHQEDSLPCHKLLDENLLWNEHANELVRGQSNFLVVGVLGKQSVGKSTIMSLLAGTRAEQVLTKAKPFPVASTAALEVASHQTYGIDISVTSERVILLDSQPLLSTSILDRMKYNERYAAGEPGAMELYRLHSYQLITFLYEVCHVVIIVQDSAHDLDTPHFVQMAEMLRPTPGGQSDASSGGQGSEDAPSPHVVLVHNKASANDFLMSNVHAVHHITDHLFKQLKGRIHGGMSTLQSGLVLCEDRQKRTPGAAVNFFLLPSAAVGASGNSQPSHAGKSGHAGAALTLAYHGHPPFATAASSLVRHVLSVPPHRLAQGFSAMTETQWFAYAGRVWEAIKKSPLFADLETLLRE